MDRFPIPILFLTRKDLRKPISNRRFLMKIPNEYSQEKGSKRNLMRLLLSY